MNIFRLLLVGSRFRAVILLFRPTPFPTLPHAPSLRFSASGGGWGAFCRFAGRPTPLPGPRSQLRGASSGLSEPAHAPAKNQAAHAPRPGHRQRRAESAGLQLVERVPARGGRGPESHRVSAEPSGWRRLSTGPGHARGHHYFRRGPGQARAVCPGRQAGHLPGPNVLYAQHQHLPRPALGPGPGNLRRRPLPDRPAGRRWCGASRATTRSIKGDCQRQALRRAQRPGVVARTYSMPRSATRTSSRPIPPPSGADSDAKVLRDVRLQRFRRPALLRQQQADEHPTAPSLGFPGYISTDCDGVVLLEKACTK